jgi:superfamily II DNA/RNA helicase
LNSFSEMGVNARTLSALARQGIEEPLPVQAASVPTLLDGRDLVIEAPTGSGKSLAFLLPLVDHLLRRDGPGPRALVVTPTRELAMQVEAVFRSLDSGLRSALLYGGTGYATQTVALKAGPAIVIGTPGRILDMVERRLMSLSRLEHVVLDEADEMLDQGFAPDVERILGQTWQPQLILASATMPDWVRRMIDKHMQDPERVQVEPAAESTLEHGLLRVRRDEKIDVLSRLLELHGGTAIAFGRTKHGVAKLSRDLQRRGHRAMALQGNLSQPARDRAMDAFRNGRSDVLVATNVAARGLDISHVGLVVNYDLPDTPQWLTHRIGRTARNGAAGRALTFLSPEDRELWSRLQRQGAPALPEVDAELLLEQGEWRFQAAAAPEPARPQPRARRRNTARPKRPQAGSTSSR